MRKYILLVLGVMFTIFISCLPTLAYFSYNQNISGEITLGELDFIVKYDDINFDSIMPGDEISTNICIINARDTNGTNYQNLVPIFIKFNIQLNVDTELLSCFSIKFSNENEFKVVNDIYYHLKTVSPSEVVNIIKSITIDKNLTNFFQGKDISLIITVDAIQATEEAVMELWPEIYNYLYQ